MITDKKKTLYLVILSMNYLEDYFKYKYTSYFEIVIIEKVWCISVGVSVNNFITMIDDGVLD